MCSLAVGKSFLDKNTLISSSSKESDVKVNSLSHYLNLFFSLGPRYDLLNILQDSNFTLKVVLLHPAGAAARHWVCRWKKTWKSLFSRNRCAQAKPMMELCRPGGCKMNWSWWTEGSTDHIRFILTHPCFPVVRPNAEFQILSQYCVSVWR